MAAPSPVLPLEHEIVDLVRRIRDTTGSYVLPHDSRRIEAVLNTLDPTDPDDHAFISVWEWIGSALGLDNVRMQDMIAFPIQYADPDNKAFFERSGFAMDKTFDAATSASVVTSLVSRLEGDGITFLSFVLNLQLRLKHKLKTNVVTKSWRKPSALVLGYRLDWVGNNQRLLEILVAAQGEEGTSDASKSLVFPLMEVMDPMQVLSSLSTLFPGEQQRRLERYRETLVRRMWPGESLLVADYDDFLVDMVQYEGFIRRRGDPDMLRLFYDIQDGIPGRAQVVVTQILSYEQIGNGQIPPLFIADRFVFAGIESRRSEWMIGTVATYEDMIDPVTNQKLSKHETGNVLLGRAVSLWTRRHMEDATFLPQWGEELLYYVLRKGVEDRLAIIVANVPRGIVPEAWISGALEFAAFSDDPAVLRKVTGRLIDHGMIDPKTFRVGPERLTLVELAAANPASLELMEERFKHALKKGAPYPSQAVVAAWTPDAQLTFRSVAGAVAGLFRWH